MCQFEGCDRKPRSKGFCHTHYEQMRRGKELTPIGSTSRKIFGGTCIEDGCGNPRQKTHGGFFSRCGSCRNIQYLNTKTDEELDAIILRRKEVSLKSNHNISLEEAQLLWEKQRCKCAVCARIGPGTYIPGRFWVIDHDHDCCPNGKSCGQCIRGIVCHPCNNYLLVEHMTIEAWEGVGRYLGYAP